MGISAIILTHNSADTIGATLQSVRFCDELLVVDDYSTDATVERATQFGATVYTRRLQEDFAAQRNFALSKANGKWVLYVDADEVVSEDLAAEIREAISQVDVGGFFLRRQDMMWNHPFKYGETQRVRLLRLAKKGTGTWQRPVHEVWQVAGVVGTLTHPLLHTPHPDVAHFLNDINSYSTINARYLRRIGVRSSWWQIIVYPSAKFFRNYIFRRGFLDGMPGMIVALMMSFHSFLTRSKLWHLQHTRD